MKVIQLETQEINTLKDVICDSCGNSCKQYMDKENESFTFECMTLKANWGYPSNKDMERWTAQLCEPCVDKFLTFIKFKKDRLRFNTVIGTMDDQSNHGRQSGTQPYPGISD